MYSRRGENGERIVARIVAVKEGIIKAKIEPEADGENQAEAMKAFRRDVEVKLDQLLQTIPSGSSSIVPGSSGLASPASPVPSDAPPSYTSTGFVGVMDNKIQK